MKQTWYQDYLSPHWQCREEKELCDRQGAEDNEILTYASPPEVQPPVPDREESFRLEDHDFWTSYYDKKREKLHAGEK